MCRQCYKSKVAHYLPNKVEASTSNLRKVFLGLEANQLLPGRSRCTYDESSVVLLHFFCEVITHCLRECVFVNGFDRAILVRLVEAGRDKSWTQVSPSEECKHATHVLFDKESPMSAGPCVSQLYIPVTSQPRIELVRRLNVKSALTT